MAYSGKEIQEALNKHGYNLDVDGIVGPKTTAAIKHFQTEKGLQVDGIVGEKTWGALTGAQTQAAAPAPSVEPAAPAQTQQQTPMFSYGDGKPSDTVAQAQALLQQHMAQKPGPYQSTWEGQLNDTIQQILNRDKFSYDVNGDALYQQYADQYVRQGKLAMMDTMGQAAALTGGYGSSYGQSVGQQAYQGYLQQLNEVVPELYQLALNRYTQEGQDLLSRYGLMSEQEEQDYGRYQDSLSAYYSELDRLTEDARYQSETDYGRYMDQYNMAYAQHRDQIADQQWQKQYDESVRQWQTEYDENLRRYEESKAAAAYSGGDGDKPTYVKYGNELQSVYESDFKNATTYAQLEDVWNRLVYEGVDPQVAADRVAYWASENKIPIPGPEPTPLPYENPTTKGHRVVDARTYAALR